MPIEAVLMWIQWLCCMNSDWINLNTLHSEDCRVWMHNVNEPRPSSEFNLEYRVMIMNHSNRNIITAWNGWLMVIDQELPEGADMTGFVLGTELGSIKPNQLFGPSSVCLVQ